MGFKTEQEDFWANDFGNDYVDRNQATPKAMAARLSFWSKIINAMPDEIQSCLEFGPNIGMNLRALGTLLPKLRMVGVEINKKAAQECEKLERVHVYQSSILDFESEEKYDLTFTCGVLIHINPEELAQVYDKLYHCSTKYILVSEYYNPTPTEVNYRGNSERLFKRDFAGEIMDRFQDLRLLNYGFVYHRDNHFPSDDVTWFLMEKH